MNLKTVHLATSRRVEGEPDTVYLSLVVDGKTIDLRMSRPMAASVASVLLASIASLPVPTLEPGSTD